MTTSAAAIGTMTGRMMMKETIPGTAEGNGTMKIKIEAGSVAETGKVTAAAGMTVLMAMTGTAGETEQHACMSTHRKPYPNACKLQSEICMVFGCAVAVVCAVSFGVLHCS